MKIINRGDSSLKFITFLGENIPIVLARKLLTITGYVIPLNKFHRDLYSAIFLEENKK